MPSSTRYTIRFLDRPEAARQEADCSSDGEAINLTHDLAAGRPAELWCGERRVLTLSVPIGGAAFLSLAGPRPARRRRFLAPVAPLAHEEGQGAVVDAA